ncbi:MAG: class I SAM-dependent methyltransferase [Verrucomicrobia bacterium]|nr:class I SAM-dependent methyltransferase [Verrucomicrobiota bacterium]
MPQPFVTRAVLRAVQGLPGFPALSVLDLSCGEGEILNQLASRGCRVQGTHYREDDYIVKERTRLVQFPVCGGVNLHQALPFDSGLFDVVLLIEVLEHLESHFNAVAEAGRVLKGGGHLLLTTPNIFRLHSRLRFFLTGKHKLIRRRYGWDLRPADRYAYHINPVDFPLLHTLLHHAGLELKAMPFTLVKWKSAFFLPLWPLVWLACRLTVDRPARQSAACREGERALNRWLTHPALLASEQLFIVARRRE